MQRIDLPAFELFMQELAELYGVKPYTGPALKHWVSALSEFSWEKVKYRLILWRDSKPKTPMISDILPGLRDAVSDEIERQAISDKAQAARRIPTPVTPHGIACMAKIREIMSKPKRPGTWRAYELRDKHRSGEVLGYAQQELAKKACGRDWDTDRPYPGETRLETPFERVVGEDDE